MSAEVGVASFRLLTFLSGACGVGLVVQGVYVGVTTSAFPWPMLTTGVLALVLTLLCTFLELFEHMSRQLTELQAPLPPPGKG